MEQIEKIETTIKLSLAQLNIILTHLGKGAFNEVADLINDLRGQAMPQIAAAQKPPVAVVEAPAVEESKLAEDSKVGQ